MCTGMEGLLFGTAAAEGVAATSGLIGVGGAFSASSALMTAGTALSVVGQAQQGKAQQEAYNTQAQQTLNDAAYRSDAAKAQAEKIRKAGRTQAGEANASLAASGVKLGDGTALEVDKQITQNTEEDALSAILSGKRTMTAAQQEAKLLGKASGNSSTNSIFGAASTVLSAAGSASKGGWKISAKGGD